MSDEFDIKSPAEDEFFDELVAQALERMEKEGLSGVQAFLREHPAHQEVLRKRLATLHAVGLVSEQSAVGDGVPERLGEFKLISKLGGGGMGVVYVAEQESLGRRVALKLVRPDLLYFPGARERFQREVQAIARLSHPGIVPVYSVGEDGGVPWFAMELVNGATVNECIEQVAHRTPRDLRAEDLQLAVNAVLAKRGATTSSDSDVSFARSKSPSSDGSIPRPARGESSDSVIRLYTGSWPAACARLIFYAANAVAHAHERGVLHRDLKPSNLLLTRSGRVLLFDFGLATAEGSHQLTRSGIRLGSLAYMSPEQVDGDASALDERSDIWSLGVALYELLTLTLPFRGETGDAIAAAIRICQPTPPRRINPAIPEDLETVVLTALERDPARRYATAQALADDLQNVLELRPINARRPSMLMRGLRFMQRRPAVSLAIVLAAVIAVGGPSLLIWHQHRSLEQEKRAADEIRGALARAEANFDLAISAVETMLLRVGDKTLKDVPQATAVRRELLQDATQFFEQLQSDRTLSSSYMTKSLHALSRLMFVYHGDGDWAALEPVARRITEQAEALLVRFGPDSDIYMFLAQGHEGLEAFHRFGGRLEEATVEADASLAAARNASRLLGLHRVGTVVLASAIDRRARIRFMTGATEAAEEDFLEGIATMRELYDADPSDLEVGQRLAMALNNYGDLMNRLKRPADAEPALSEAIDLLRALIAAHPESSDAIVALAACETNIASLLARQKEYERAIGYCESAFARLEAFTTAFPSRFDGLQSFSNCGNVLASHYLNYTTRDADAVRVLRTITEPARRALELAPETNEQQITYIAVLLNRAIAERRNGDFPAALECANEALGAFNATQRTKERDTGLYRTIHQQLGLAFAESGDHARGAQYARDLVHELPDDAIVLRMAGIIVTKCLAAVSRDTVEVDDRAARQIEYGSEAIALLTRAKQLGAIKNSDLEKAKDYEPLRGLAEFKELLALPEPAPR